MKPGAPGEHYPSHGQGIGPATVWRSDALPPNGYGEAPNATVEARQMQSAGAGAGPVGLRPSQGAPVLSTRPAEEAGYMIPHGLRQPNGSSGARTHPVQGANAEPRGALVPYVVHPENQK